MIDDGSGESVTSGHTNQNIKSLRLELTQKLHNQNIVQDFVLNQNGYFIIQLNHKYDKKTIPLQFDFRHYQKSLELFEYVLGKKGINQKHVRLLTDTIDENHEKIIPFLKSCEMEARKEAAQEEQILDYVQRKSSNEQKIN